MLNGLPRRPLSRRRLLVSVIALAATGASAAAGQGWYIYRAEYHEVRSLLSGLSKALADRPDHRGPPIAALSAAAVEPVGPRRDARAPSPQAAPAPASAADGAEVAFWESVRAARNPDDLRAYLHVYPRGRFAELARLWLDRSGRETPRSEAGVDYGRYFALVIGNNDYRHLHPLNTAVSDARAIARLLAEQYGFEVTRLENASRYQIMTALAELRAALGPGDNLLIYYAGHGVLDRKAGQGYWQPVDAEEHSPANWIANSDLTTALRAISAKHVLIVADSCYSGTLMRSGIALGPPRLAGGDERQEWLRRTARKRARTALTSGGAEPVEDGAGEHSVFSTTLLGALGENDDVIDAHSLAIKIKQRVAADAEQTPEYGDIRQAGHEGGDFLFVRRRR